MSFDKITIQGAREHNLKNIDIEVPREKLVVFTGLSGSGKSSLAFDTIYAEGQRRYVESLSAYARQFLGQMEKPDVDYIEGLSPAISIDQKTTSKNPRSTVGTVTEIYDYLRLMYARIGVPHCPKCGVEIQQQTIDQICDQVLSFEEGTRMLILAPVIRAKKGQHQKVLETAKKNGYVRVRVDGEMRELEEDINLEKTKKHDIDIVVDRLIIRPGVETRLTDSLETALGLAGGLAYVSIVDGEEILFSQNYACSICGMSIEELSPRMFSFNSPYGACPTCAGLGTMMKVDPELIMDKKKSIRQGGILAGGWGNVSDENSLSAMYFGALAKEYGFSLDTPIAELPQEILNVILYGSKGKKMQFEYKRSFGSTSYMGTFEGIVNNLERRYAETQSDYAKAEIEAYMSNIHCPDCVGKRLKPEVLAVTVGGKNIYELTSMSIVKIMEFLDQLELTPKQQQIAHQILKEIKARLGFLVNVGLDYLTLSRSAGTLSGGEAQRIRSGNADWIWSDGCFVYTGRTQYRTASAGQ